MVLCSELSGGWKHYILDSHFLAMYPDNQQLAQHQGRWLLLAHRGSPQEDGPVCQRSPG